MFGAETDISEGQADEHAERHRNSNARAGDQCRRKSRLFQFFQVGFQTRREHQKQYADFREDRKSVRTEQECFSLFVDTRKQEQTLIRRVRIGLGNTDQRISAKFAENGGSDDDSGNDIAEYLRQSDFSEQQSAQFCAEQDNCQNHGKSQSVVNVKYAFHSSLSLSDRKISISVVHYNSILIKRQTFCETFFVLS